MKNLFYIDQVGHAYDRVFSKTFDYLGQRHNFIESVYIVSGCVQITEDGKVYVLHEGDIIFHAPMEFHCIKSYANTSPRVRNLSFTVIGNLPSMIFDGVYHLNAEQTAQYIKCFDLAYRYENEKTRSLYWGQYVSSNISSLLIDICTESQKRDAISNEASALLFSKIVTAMQESVGQNCSLSDLAKSNSISVSYLKKLFIRYASMSPKVFYNSLRAKEAVRLLEAGKAVGEIADIMNFSSPNYFSLFFKKYFGCAPLEYKRKRR